MDIANRRMRKVEVSNSEKIKSYGSLDDFDNIVLNRIRYYLRSEMKSLFFREVVANTLELEY